MFYDQIHKLDLIRWMRVRKVCWIVPVVECKRISIDCHEKRYLNPKNWIVFFFVASGIVGIYMNVNALLHPNTKWNS